MVFPWNGAGWIDYMYGIKCFWTLLHTIRKNQFQMDYRSKYEREKNKTFRGKHRTSSWSWNGQKLFKLSQKALTIEEKYW